LRGERGQSQDSWHPISDRVKYKKQCLVISEATSVLGTIEALFYSGDLAP